MTGETAEQALAPLSRAARSMLTWGGYNQPSFELAGTTSAAATEELLAAGHVRRAPEHGGAIVLTETGADLSSYLRAPHQARWLAQEQAAAGAR